MKAAKPKRRKLTEVERLIAKEKRERLQKIFATLWRMRFGGNLEPTPELEYCSRGWRFDFAWPDKRVAVEIDGGNWSKHTNHDGRTWRGGRHTTPQGFQEDLKKRNVATLLGWRVLGYTGDDLTHRPDEVLQEVYGLLTGAFGHSSATPPIPRPPKREKAVRKQPAEPAGETHEECEADGLARSGRAAVGRAEA